jgi:hypothetical protein
MQSLFYAIIGKGDQEELKEESTKKEDYETLECPEDQTINQIHRKIKLLNDFKNYILKAKTNHHAVYYRYIINTTIHEYEHENDTSVVSTILPGIFGKLNEYRTSDISDDIFRSLSLLDL